MEFLSKIVPTAMLAFVLLSMLAMGLSLVELGAACEPTFLQ